MRVGDLKIVSEAENHGTWELYNLADDRIESNDLAADQPARVKAMAEQWQRLDDQYRTQAATSEK